MIAHKPSAEILSAGQVNFFFRPPSRYSRSAATAALDMMRRWGADGVRSSQLQTRCNGVVRPRGRPEPSLQKATYLPTRWEFAREVVEF